MITNSWSRLIMTTSGNISIKQSKNTYPINKIKCDRCGTEYDERNDHTLKRYKLYGEYLCSKCSKKQRDRWFSEIGAKTLKSFTKKQKRKYCIDAGKISAQKSPNNSGRFNSARWNSMSKKDQRNQVTKANRALYDKLNGDETLKREHYLKIFKNSRIGFTSKGHNELHEFLKEFGFAQHYQISDMETDECNEDLKIVVEFNGDMYHCNPRTWKPEQYNTVIKMLAKEKWKKDRNRYYKLKNLGYISFVVWEEDWASKRDYIKEKLTEFISKRKNEITIKKEN